MYPPVIHTDRYVQRRDPDRAVKPPPRELPHRQDGDHMKRLAVLTANHCYVCMVVAAKKAAFCHRSLLYRQPAGPACPWPTVYETSRLLEQDRKWSASGLRTTEKRCQPVRSG